MEITTHDMERPAAMPMAAPVGAVAPGRTLAAVKPWTNRYDRPIGQLFDRGMTGRPARHLGRAST